MRRVLFICYYFPPFGGGGTFRAAKFAKYLSAFGWEPVVLTVKPRGVWAEDTTQLDELQHVRVVHTDSFHPIGYYREIRDSGVKLPAPIQAALQTALVDLPDRLMIPDNRLGWVPFALQRAIELHRESRFDLVFTNSRPHSTHFTGMALKKITGLPWVADFKDGWNYCPYK